MPKYTKWTCICGAKTATHMLRCWKCLRINPEAKLQNGKLPNRDIRLKKSLALPFKKRGRAIPQETKLNIINDSAHIKVIALSKTYKVSESTIYKIIRESNQNKNNAKSAIDN